MADLSKKQTFHQKNLNLVLQQIINYAPISRIDIARNLKMNKSSITALYNEIEQQGYLKEVGIGQASKSGGRKPILVALNEKYGYTISIDLGYKHLHIMANYLNSKDFYYQRIKNKSTQIKDILQTVDEQIDLIAQKEQSLHGLLGIAFSIHGIVDQTQIVNSPFLNMEDLNLQSHYSQKYGVPVLLENEANLAAIFEHDFNNEHNKANLLCVSIHKGIGAGIILNQQIYRGFQGAAGEIGRTIISSNNMKAENLYSEDAIIERLRQLKQNASLERADLTRLEKNKDQDVKLVLKEFIAGIAQILFNASVSLAPEEIYLSSPLLEELPEVFSAIQQQTSELGMLPQLYLIANSTYATLLGASSLVIHHVLNLDNYNLKFTYHKK
ncbi:ROK family protein [Bombilactobacillus bombi]|uniref:ROK family protein n=1 Tax=Bombilactobacillus bombi TaxID=1303590 RepID=UPI0015E5F4EB|nr:ROK family protein [Bombilactobacillus bombi]MBA1433848.1 ROK family protein [Bombilactobacillus bombi]